MNRLGKHEFSGSCSPDARGAVNGGYTSFSVGIFEWVLKKDGKRLKRSAVKVRVRGLVSNSERVYEKAREIVAALDAGAYSGPKNVKV